MILGERDCCIRPGRLGQFLGTCLQDGLPLQPHRPGPQR
jgi:hypothetical protein